MGSNSVSNLRKAIQSSGLNLEALPPSSPSTTSSDPESLGCATASKKDVPTMQDLERQLLEAQVEKARAEADSALSIRTLEGMRIFPSNIHPVRIYHNQVTWVCEYVGCADATGCGDSPFEACLAFDKMWMGDGMDG